MPKRGGVRGSYKVETILPFKTRSQIAVEFIVILAFVLIIFITLIAIDQDLMNSVGGQYRAEKAKIVINELGDAAQQVYQQGVGAQTRIFVSIPKGVYSTQVSGQTLRISLTSTSQQTRDVYKNLNFQVIGYIPTEEGNYWITVKSRPGYVVVGYSLLEIIPSGFSKTLTPGNSSSEKISLRNIIDTDVGVQLSYSGDANIDVDLDQTNLLLSPDQTKNVSLTISAQDAAQPGVYTGIIEVDANSSTESQTTSIIVMVTVPSIGPCEAWPAIVLYPELWDEGNIGIDEVYSSLFYVCNNLENSQSVGMSFTNTNYLGFNPGVSSKLTIVNVPAQSCNTTYVYINTTNATNEDYTSQLLAIAGENSDTSTITFNITEDTFPPQVNLMFPQDNYTSLLGNLIFKYNVTDIDSAIAYCELIINNSVKQTDNTIQEGVEQSFTLLGLGNGNYTWTVNCTDDSPAANEGTGGTRKLIINFTTVYATPTLAFEEDNDPQWTTEVQYIGDGLYATAVDEGSPDHANYPPPDYVEFDFPNLGISGDYGINTVILTIRHYEDIQGGWFDEDERHQIECYNNVEWISIGTWQWTPEDNMTWIYYISPDLSNCISTVALANDIHVRITYDPADDTDAVQYIDWAQVEVNISTAYYPNLWELFVDGPQPLDFSSGLNTTANTFGRLAGNDGWDWQEDTYGGADSSAEFNVDPNMDGNKADSTVATNNRIEVKVGGSAPGAPANADDDSYNGPASSGAYGVEFNITDQLYGTISGGGKALLSFDWVADQDAGWGNDLDSGDEAWIKARLITPTQTIWLGSDLDTGDNDEDTYNEIWFMDNPVDDYGSENIDITSYITQQGIYYIDLGVAVGDWDQSQEGFGAYFDNIQLIIIQ